MVEFLLWFIALKIAFKVLFIFAVLILVAASCSP